MLNSVIHTRYTLGQACLSFVVRGIMTGASVRKLAESRLNRAYTAAVRGIGERFVACQLERVSRAARYCVIQSVAGNPLHWRSAEITVAR